MSHESSLLIGLAFNGIDHDPDDAVPGVSTAQADYWLPIVSRADAAGLDFVSFDDAFAAPDQAGRTPLDAVLLASRIGPQTEHIGVIAASVLSFNEPFHISTAIATLDFITAGRAGLLAVVPAAVQVARTREHTGRNIPGVPSSDRDALYRDAQAAVDTIRRLWDSWEDDAEIRDVSSGRFVDRDKLHYVNVETAYFRVKGPSIVPRPPQGQPIVAVGGGDAQGLALAAAHADVLFIAPHDEIALRVSLRAAGEATATVDRAAPLRVIADLAVSFVEGPSSFDSTHGAVPVFRGTAEALALHIQAWHALGLDGFRLHPLAPHRDSERLVQRLLPLLRSAGAYPQQHSERSRTATLRERLGLPTAINRYTRSAEAA